MDTFRTNASVGSIDSLRSVRSSFSSPSSSDTDVDTLNFDCLTLHNKNLKYSKFERYFRGLIKLGRKMLAKDRNFDRPDLHFVYADKCYLLRDRIHKWFCRPGNSALFRDRNSYAYVLQVKCLLERVENALVLDHAAIAWPEPPVADVRLGEVWRAVDVYVFAGGELKSELLPWNIEGDVEMTG